MYSSFAKSDLFIKCFYTAGFLQNGLHRERGRARGWKVRKDWTKTAWTPQREARASKEMQRNKPRTGQDLKGRMERNKKYLLLSQESSSPAENFMIWKIGGEKKTLLSGRCCQLFFHFVSSCVTEVRAERRLRSCAPQSVKNSMMTDDNVAVMALSIFKIILNDPTQCPWKPSIYVSH